MSKETQVKRYFFPLEVQRGFIQEIRNFMIPLSKFCLTERSVKTTFYGLVAPGLLVYSAIEKSWLCLPVTLEKIQIACSLLSIKKTFSSSFGALSSSYGRTGII